MSVKTQILHQFFPDKRFSREVHRTLVLSFSVKKKLGSMNEISGKSQKLHIYHIFDIYWMIQIFLENPASSLSFFILLQLHAKFWNDPMISFGEKLRTDGLIFINLSQMVSLWKSDLVTFWLVEGLTWCKKSDNFYDSFLKIAGNRRTVEGIENSR